MITIKWLDYKGDVIHRDFLEEPPTEEWLDVRKTQLEGAFWKDLTVEVVEDEIQL